MCERVRSRSPRGAFDRGGAEGHLRRREPFGDSGMRPRSEERERHRVARGGDRGLYRPGGRGPSPVRVERYHDLAPHRNMGGGSAMRGTGGGSYGLGDGRPMPSQRPPETRAGDWICPSCGVSVFGSKSSCFRCDTPNPAGDGGGIAGPGSRPGDWNCPRCRVVVFASRQKCFKCNMPNPSPVRREQGWECSGCFAKVPGHIMTCRCGQPRPGTAAPPELSDAEKKQLESIEREIRQDTNIFAFTADGAEYHLDARTGRFVTVPLT